MKLLIIIFILLQCFIFSNSYDNTKQIIKEHTQGVTKDIKKISKNKKSIKQRFELQLKKLEKKTEQMAKDSEKKLNK